MMTHAGRSPDLRRHDDLGSVPVDSTDSGVPESHIAYCLASSAAVEAASVRIEDV